MSTLSARKILFKLTVTALFINSFFSELHLLDNFLNKNPKFMLTQTMSTDDVQPIKNVQIE